MAWQEGEFSRPLYAAPPARDAEDAKRWRFVRDNARRLDIGGLCIPMGQLEVRVDQLRDAARQERKP
jgi:hypothetical protein